MNAAMEIATMTVMMVVPLVVGVGFGYLVLQGMMELLKAAVLRAQPAAPVVDNVIEFSPRAERTTGRLAA